MEKLKGVEIESKHQNLLYDVHKKVLERLRKTKWGNT